MVFDFAECLCSSDSHCVLVVLCSMANYFIETQLGALAEAQGTSIRSLKATIREVAEDLTVATACSGTDSPLVLAKYWGLKGLFSCEFDDLKQKWIMENFPETKRLFSDIKTLKRNEARLYKRGLFWYVFNIVTQTKEKVPSAGIFITGFVCKSVSTENNDRKTYKNCIDEARQTGETFSGMMSYIRKHLPMVVIAENVQGITKRNDGEDSLASDVVDYEVLVMLCKGSLPRNTSDFGIPQSRNRCWMVGLRKERFSQDDVDEIFDMIELMKTKGMSLKKYFEHFKVGQAGMPETSRLNPRQKKVRKAGLKKVENRRRPRDQERFLSAEEALSLQGIFCQDFPAERSFLAKHRRLCHDLTGNAFSMSVCSAVLTAVMLKLAEV
eukprot:Skav210128  [mRNA]  locus=scaffold2194:384868:388083:+ [translate_table: standard]